MDRQVFVKIILNVFGKVRTIVDTKHNYQTAFDNFVKNNALGFQVKSFLVFFFDEL